MNVRTSGLAYTKHMRESTGRPGVRDQKIWCYRPKCSGKLTAITRGIYEGTQRKPSGKGMLKNMKTEEKDRGDKYEGYRMVPSHLKVLGKFGLWSNIARKN